MPRPLPMVAALEADPAALRPPVPKKLAPPVAAPKPVEPLALLVPATVAGRRAARHGR